MALNREELAADLVWRYVERVREARAAGEPVALTRAELAQLAESLELAAQMPDALEGAEGAESADRRLAVRRRLDETVGAAASLASERPATPSGPPVVAPWQLPTWGSRALLGTALAMSLALATVNQWHRPAPVVKRLRVPVDEAAINVQPVEEASVHELLPRMVRNELPPQEERNLMWHMLVCRGCFDQYVQLKHTTQTASEVRQELIRLVQR